MLSLSQEASKAVLAAKSKHPYPPVKPRKSERPYNRGRAALQGRV